MPVQTPNTDPTSTRESLLDAAEGLFAERGIARASVRAITRAAGANLASVHYHFGSKEGLVRAVLARRLAPLNQERLRLLAAALAAADGHRDLQGIVHAFVAPVFRMIHRDPGGGAFVRLMGRAISEPGEQVTRVLEEEFRPVLDRFLAALRATLPHLPEEELHWRFHFAVGAMAHTACAGALVARASRGLCDPSDVDGLVRRLVGFLTAGLGGPAAAPEEAGR